jgi:hypothetical protein
MKKLLLALVLGLCTSAFGQIPDSAWQAAPQISWGGYIETYYTYNFNQPASGNVPYLYNYTRHNEFNVNNALIRGTYATDRVRANLGLMAGTYAAANYAAEDPMFRHLYDANMGFRLAKGLWLEAGIRGSSHIGFESAASQDNWTLSRSLISENTPFFESGAWLTWDPNPKWTFCAHLLNGWQNIRETNKSKAGGTQITFRPSDKLTLNSSTFIGNEKPDSMPQLRLFHNFYAIWQATDKFGIALGYDIGTQKNPARTLWNVWQGTALLLRYGITDKWKVTARGEYYSDPTNIIVSAPGKYEVLGYSLNLDYLPADNMMFRIEGRNFSAQDKIYVNKDGAPVNTSPQITASLLIAF